MRITIDQLQAVFHDIDCRLVLDAARIDPDQDGLFDATAIKYLAGVPFDDDDHEAAVEAINDIDEAVAELRHHHDALFHQVHSCRTVAAPPDFNA